MSGGTFGVNDLVVRYGARRALDHIDVDVAAGDTLAVIGGDGAGKSTLLRAFAGERLDLSGTVTIPPADRIGYVPSAGGFYPDLTVSENVEFVAAAFALKGWRPRAAELLRRAQLDRFPNRLAGVMSGGQRRKLAASMAVLPNPDLLVLDEVTTGVDPVSRMELWKILNGAAAAGAAVVVATTYLDEAERMTHALLLDDGNALAHGTPESIEQHTPGHVYDVAEPIDANTAWRRGRRWRQWSPTRLEGRTPMTLGLEDAAIVLELAQHDTEGAS